MWGDLIFLISPFIMPKFADNLTITGGGGAEKLEGEHNVSSWHKGGRYHDLVCHQKLR